MRKGEKRWVEGKAERKTTRARNKGTGVQASSVAWRSGVRCPQIQVLVLLLNVGKLSLVLRLSVAMC